MCDEDRAGLTLLDSCEFVVRHVSRGFLAVVMVFCGCQTNFDAPRLVIRSLQVSLVCWKEQLPVDVAESLTVKIQDQAGRDVTAFPQTITWRVSAPTFA